MARKKHEPNSAEPPTSPGKITPLRGGSVVPDTPDVRAKSSGHRKKTADKWNQ
jgi:hypothetical protein